MAEDAAARANEGDSGSGKNRLYTLTEVSNKTSISMPTLQRYKKNYQDRIPSVGKGRKQRYPEEALEVFEQIKKENVKRRGRPPKKAAAKAKGGAKRGRPAKKQAAGGGGGKEKEGLLTLTKIAEETGISYPTLVRYVKLYGDQIPYEGKGRSRRYHPQAIEVFKRLRKESPRGRRKKKATAGRAAAKAAPRGRAAGASDAGLARRVQSLENAQANLERQIKELIKQLRKPLKVTINR